MTGKIERILYGMFDGKIQLIKTSGVSSLISYKNVMSLARKDIKDSGKAFWLGYENTIAIPFIKNVVDEHGRDFVQNQIFLIGIHDYLALSNVTETMKKFYQDIDKIPDRFEAITV